MKRFSYIFAFLLSYGFSLSLSAQCETWEAYPKGVKEARKQHVIYQDRFDMQRYEEAYPIWEELFQYVKVPVPAKTTHFLDGAFMCFHFAGKETDADKKLEWMNKAIDLYDQNAACNGEDALDRAYQAYYMYANQYDIVKTIAVYEKSFELGKEKAPAMIVDPLARLSTYAFTQDVEGFDAKHLRDLYQRLKKLCDTNIKAGKDADSYKKAWEAVEAMYADPAIENKVFGCDYWKKKYMVKVSQDPNNKDLFYEAATKLAAKCGKEDPIYKDYWKRYLEMVDAENDAMWDEKFNADTTTAYMKILLLRQRARKTGSDSIKALEMNYYEEALSSDKEWTSDEVKADLAYRYADKLYRKGAFGKARQYCRKASALRPDWGQPYVLVGIMYASSGKRCSPSTNGTGFNAQVCVWPAMDEWMKARSVDPASAARANGLINKYSEFLPTQTDIFQRQLKEGTSYTVGCWIQQTTTIRAKK